MLLITKIGTKWPGDPSRGWRDGQIVDIRPDDYSVSDNLEGKHFAFIRVPADFWALRKTTDWKAWNPDIEVLTKYLYPVDSLGKYLWEFGVLKDENIPRVRDWFVDYKWLLNEALITKKDFDSIYNKDIAAGIFNIDRDFTTLLFHEDEKSRLDSIYKEIKGSIATGTYQIGTGVGWDYATVTTFEADIAATLTGDLTGEHQNEETAVAATIQFNLDTSTHSLTLTAESGAEHNGGAYGNGARLNYATSTSIQCNNANIDNFEISKLAIDSSGASNEAFKFRTLVSGLANRLLISGASSASGIDVGDAATGTTNIRNCIIYATTTGIHLNVLSAGRTVNLYNNTVIGCGKNFHQDPAASDATFNTKNNLAQAGSTWDYDDDGASWGTTSKNLSEDASSPDAAYQSKDVHTNSVFINYAADDFRLDSGGDGTNLAILDDGDDLSGTFTDDIEGQTRSTWYIGASEIVAAGGLSIPVAMHHYQYNLGR